jgi:acetoin utilization deacetylase AcuC-like enzyme
MTGSAPVLVVSTRLVDDHQTGDPPESPARLQAVHRGLEHPAVRDTVHELSPRPASMAELERVHAEGYLHALADLAAAGGGDLDPDTPTSPGSWRTACWAAGAGLTAVDALTAGDGHAAFVVTRPPGHHATRARGMGFCLVNNIAVTAAALADRGERVAILDWDVHHGNGTEGIFWNDPRVLYASIHQWPAYPGTGRATDTGGPGAPGLTVNVPLPPGATGDAAMAAIDDAVVPVVDGFEPTWVLVSAGFDAHRDDPLADLRWSAGDFAMLTARVMAMAPEPGRLVAFLEGGYSLGALERSVSAMVAQLAGAEHCAEPPTAGGLGRAAVVEACKARARALGGAS